MKWVAYTWKIFALPNGYHMGIQDEVVLIFWFFKGARDCIIFSAKMSWVKVKQLIQSAKENTSLGSTWLINHQFSIQKHFQCFHLYRYIQVTECLGGLILAVLLVYVRLRSGNQNLCFLPTPALTQRSIYLIY